MLATRVDCKVTSNAKQGISFASGYNQVVISILSNAHSIVTMFELQIVISECCLISKQ